MEKLSELVINDNPTEILDIKKIVIDEVSNLKHLILPHKNKNWEKNRHYLEHISKGSVKNKEDLYAIFQEMHEGIEIKNLIDFTQLKSPSEWVVQFIPTILPFIANMALQVEDIFQENEVQILQTERRQANHLTREQAACLLANMFFSTFEEQPIHNNVLPSTFDFKNWLTSIPDKKRNQSNLQKVVCLIHYFYRVQQEISTKDSAFSKQIITYERLINENVDLLQTLEESNQQLSEISIVDDRGIESFEEIECIHCDFANKFLGGGVLRTGCVQEEIMFSIAPELIVGMLFCDRQRDNDAILITGAERFCQFSGYAETFRFVGPHTPHNKVDNFNRKKTYTLAMNAISFKSNPQFQYEEDNIRREIIKSFIGFQGSSLFSKSSTQIPIVSGNWGCGVFKGDPQLKLIIQWLSTSLLKRKLFYCSFKAPQLKDNKGIIQLLQNKPIKTVMESLLKYSKYASKNDGKQTTVFDFINKLLK